MRAFGTPFSIDVFALRLALFQGQVPAGMLWRPTRNSRQVGRPFSLSAIQD